LRSTIDARVYFADELIQLAPLADAGLVEVDADAVRVTAAGWYVVRAVAMLFDRHLKAGPSRERLSRVV
jgi:oxygen-independent coproporphyrinogen III oxidase